MLEEPGNNAERRFNPKKWGTVTNNEVNRLYTEPVTPYFNPNENCKACLFVNNNKEVNKLIALKELEFRQIKPSSNMDHVNFP